MGGHWVCRSRGNELGDDFVKGTALAADDNLMTPWEVSGGPGTFKWISALPVQSRFIV